MHRGEFFMCDAHREVESEADRERLWKCRPQRTPLPCEQTVGNFPRAAENWSGFKEQCDIAFAGLSE
jgi:hypothetical protein